MAGALAVDEEDFRDLVSRDDVFRQEGLEYVFRTEVREALPRGELEDPCEDVLAA